MTKTYTIEGMDCGGCAVSIEMLLSAASGVQSAKVSFEDKELTLVYTEGAFDFAKSRESLQQMGYTITEK